MKSAQLFKQILSSRAGTIAVPWHRGFQHIMSYDIVINNKNNNNYKNSNNDDCNNNCNANYVKNSNSNDNT